MHIPNYFKNEDISAVKAFLKSNSFGILISSVNKKYWGTHIPLELEQDENGKEVLYGHISKANPQWKNFEKEEEVLAIFNGPHAYISASWYGHENVPTWNYIAVHVYGTLEILEEKELLHALTLLVDKYEQQSKNPVKVEKLSATTMKQIKGIIGFKINITDIQAAYKLSQNRNDADYKEIVHELHQSHSPLDQQMADTMDEKRATD